RHPRHRDRRRDPRRRGRRPGSPDWMDRVRRHDPRVGERRRRLRRHRPHARDVQEARAAAVPGRRRMSANVSNLLYLVTIVCFVLALRFLSSPTTARRGNWIGAVGMAVAIVVTLAKDEVHIGWRIIVGGLIGGVFGAVAARKVKMTA